MNMFSDFTEQEYKMRLGKKPTRDHNLETASFENSSAPSSWNWIEKGALGPVKDQGQCGSCWTFAGVGAVEAINKIENGVSEIYSEQQLVDCAVGFGCNGGWAQTAMKHLISKKANYGSDYRYTQKDGTCKEDQYTGHFSIKGVENIKQNSEQAHVDAVYKRPTAISIQADQRKFQLYSSGILLEKDCGTSTDHAVLAVGYADDYFLVRNSWSADWGDNGYIKL